MGETIRKIDTSEAPRAIGPYSQGTLCSARQLIFISGQLGIDPENGDFAGTTVAAQTRQCLKNLAAILEASGAGISLVLKTTVYLASMDSFAMMNEVYQEFFSEPYPARACIAVKELPKGALVEIDAIAAIED